MPIYQNISKISIFYRFLRIPRFLIMIDTYIYLHPKSRLFLQWFFYPNNGFKEAVGLGLARCQNRPFSLIRAPIQSILAWIFENPYYPLLKVKNGIFKPILIDKFIELKYRFFDVFLMFFNAIFYRFFDISIY